eukprot:jgi/Picsp_1/77/NSC_00077-R1_chy zinc finger family protein
MTEKDLRRILQDELLRLRHLLPGHVRVSKTKSVQSSPFPVHLFISIERPSSCSHVDVESLDFEFVLTRELAPLEMFCVERVRLGNSDIPGALRTHIEETVQNKLHRIPECPQIGFVEALGFVKNNYLRLLTGLKEFVEHYESVGENGSSVRRTMIKNINSIIEIDVSPVIRYNPNREVEALQENLRQDIAYCKVRYSDSFRLQVRNDSSEWDTFPLREDYIAFAHSKGIGTDLKNLKASLVKIEMNIMPTTQTEWIEPTAPIRLQVYIGKSYPNLPSILPIIYIEQHESSQDPEVLFLFEKLCLLEACLYQETKQIIKSIAKFCENHAEQALKNAIELHQDIVSIRETRSLECVRSQGDVQISGGSKYAILLNGLQLEGIDAVSLLSVPLELVCRKCNSLFLKQIDNISVGHKQIHSLVDCTSCGSTSEVTIDPRIIHAMSNTLGVIHCSGCLPTDILPPTTVEVQCGSCSRSASMKDALHSGRWNERRCRDCHTKTSFYFDMVMFRLLKQSDAKTQSTKDQPHRSVSTATRPKRHDTSRGLHAPDAKLPVPGEPLPEHGACRHYLHSYRWLRFPCCGRRFPCDLCHEESVEDGHEAKWALRMVCGFCSAEQSLAQRCSACGKRLTTTASRPEGRNTRYWEGGKGQRDKKMLSKKDSHKFRNTKAKTQSRKSFRVGQKAA